MDFVKLKELPKLSASINEDKDTQWFKAYKKRSEQSCGIGSDVNSMCFTPGSDAELAVACGSKLTVYNVGFSTVSESSNWGKHKNLISCLAYRKDGKLLIAADNDGHANIYDVSVTKSIIRRLRGHDGPILATTFCADGTRVATGGQDQRVKIWDVPTGQIHMNLGGHSDSIRALVPVGENGLISAGADGKVIQWDIRGPAGEKISEVSHGSPIEKIAMFESGALLFTIGGGICRLWDLRTMKEVRDPQQTKHTKPVTGAVVSACGDFLATSSFDMTVKMIRICNWEVVASYQSPSAVTAMAWQGHSLVYGSESGCWILRQRRIAEAAPEVAEDVTKTDDTRYYSTVDLSAQSRSVKTKESQADFLFRKFEYRKLVDWILETGVAPSMGMAVVDELIQRGGLEAALRNRPVKELTRIIDWANRSLLSDPRCSVRLVAQVVDTLVVSNARTFASPENAEALIKAVSVLHNKLGTEYTLQMRATQLAGLIESVVSS
jgi:U3 small nucleolar RNA-associated protein 15